MVRIIVVHGRGSKPSKSCKLRYVRDVLTKSVRRVDPTAGRWLAAHPHTVQLAYYADMLRARTGERQEDCASYRPSIDRLYAESRACGTWPRLRGFLRGLEVDATALVVRWLKPDARRRLIAKHFADAQRYLTDHALASQIRARLQQPLISSLRRQERVVLIAHSLGSVIAYDVLWKLSHMSEYRALRHRAVDLFLTLGSPLGDKVVKASLLGWRYSVAQRYPTNIRHWVNLSARGDAVCHDKRLANDFELMLQAGDVERFEEHVDLCTVYRGREGQWNPHKLYGYLILPEVGRLIASQVVS